MPRVIVLSAPRRLPSRRVTGAALVHMADFPLVSRPHVAATGGALLRRRSRRARGGLSFGDIKRAASRAFGAARNALPGLVSHARAIVPVAQRAAPHIISALDRAAMNDKGLANTLRETRSIVNAATPYVEDARAIVGLGMRRRRRRGGNFLSDFVRGFRSVADPVANYALKAAPLLIRAAAGSGGRLPRPHTVRPHMSHSVLGTPFHVRGHVARGCGGAMHVVRGHYAHSVTGKRYYVAPHMSSSAGSGGFLSGRLLRY